MDVGAVEREEEDDAEPDEEEVPVVAANEARSTDERDRECRAVRSAAAGEAGAMKETGRGRRGGGMSSASASLLSFERRIRGGRGVGSRSGDASVLDDDERGRNEESDVVDCARWCIDRRGEGAGEELLDEDGGSDSRDARLARGVDDSSSSAVVDSRGDRSGREYWSRREEEEEAARERRGV